MKQFVGGFNPGATDLCQIALAVRQQSGRLLKNATNRNDDNDGASGDNIVNDHDNNDDHDDGGGNDDDERHNDADHEGSNITLYLLMIPS